MAAKCIRSTTLRESKYLVFSLMMIYLNQVWDDRPVPSETPVESLPVILTGRTWQEKLSDVRQDMKEKNAQALIVTALDEIACKCRPKYRSLLCST